MIEEKMNNNVFKIKTENKIKLKLFKEFALEKLPVEISTKALVMPHIKHSSP
ncbi:MAG: hypothetical protein M3R36_07480 [Bacteroidota bacterium]|nr:hypothetical protein [Bacteroidota bacterium]